ncbi:hypothetical protein Tco_0734572, partial [Tanacetum coccineum]
QPCCLTASMAELIPNDIYENIFLRLDASNLTHCKSVWAACESLACIRLCPQGQSCLHAPSTCCGPDVFNIRTSYVSRQCTSSVGDIAAPCLMRRLATPD